MLLGQRAENHFHAVGVTEICGVECERVALLSQPLYIFAIPNNYEVIFIHCKFPTFPSYAEQAYVKFLVLAHVLIQEYCQSRSF